MAEGVLGNEVLVFCLKRISSDTFSWGERQAACEVTC